MSLVKPQRDPTRRQLRQFGVTCLAILPLIGWIWGAGGTTIIVLAGSGATLAVAALLRPTVLRPLFVGLVFITLPIGWVVGEIILLAVYFGVLLPIGLVFRLTGRDALRLKADPHANTYWQEKNTPDSVSRYYRQF